MTLPSALNDNEVILDNYRFPIKGGININSAQPFPGKITIGSTKRTDQTLADEWIMEDWRGGMLADQLDEESQDNRWWWSNNMWTHTRRKLHVGLKITDIYKPNGVGVNCEWIGEFFGSHKQRMVAYWPHSLYEYVEYTDAPSAWEVIGTIDYVPSDSLMFDGGLVLFTGTPTYYIYNGLSLSSYSFTSGSIKYACLFDANDSKKIVAIDTNGVIWVTNDPTDTSLWDSTLGGTIRDKIITGIIQFRNANDEPTIFVRTTTGLIAVDIWTQTAFPTSLSVTNNYDAGKGAAVWNDGNLYFSDGLAIWRYPRAGTITNVGLDRDDAIPPEYRGKVIKIIPLANYLVALVDATQEANWIDLTGTVTATNNSTTIDGSSTLFLSELLPTDTVRIASATRTINSITDNTTLILAGAWTGSGLTGWALDEEAEWALDNQDFFELIFPYSPSSSASVVPLLPIEVDGSCEAWAIENASFSEMCFPYAYQEGYGYLAAFDGSGWHTFYVTNSLAEAIRDGIFSTVYRNSRRLFFSEGQVVKYLLIPEGNIDPTIDSEYDFQAGGWIKTGWFDAGYSEIDKIAISFNARTLRLDSNNVINVEYALDNNDASYTLLGTLNTDGLTTYNFNASEGTSFKSIRFKFTFVTTGASEGASGLFTPIMLFFNLHYKKVPDTSWAFSFTVDSSSLNLPGMQISGSSPTLYSLWKALRLLKQQKKLSPFSFKMDEDIVTRFVEVVGVSGIMRSGVENSSYFTVNVVELESSEP